MESIKSRPVFEFNECFLFNWFIFEKVFYFLKTRQIFVIRYFLCMLMFRQKKYIPPLKMSHPMIPRTGISHIMVCTYICTSTIYTSFDQWHPSFEIWTGWLVETSVDFNHTLVLRKDLIPAFLTWKIFKYFFQKSLST